MMKFLRTHLVALITLVLSVVAIIISLQANEIARESNEIAKAAQAPKLSVEWMYTKVHENSYMRGCREPNQDYNNPSAKPYMVGWQWIFQGNVIVTNRGGGAASLLRVDLSPGVEIPFHFMTHNVTLSAPDGEGEDVTLPVDILPGSGKVWSLKAWVTYHWQTKQEALDKTRWSGQPDLPGPTVYSFYFSDGSVVTLSTTNGVTRDDSSLSVDLDTPCPGDRLFQ